MENNSFEIMDGIIQKQSDKIQDFEFQIENLKKEKAEDVQLIKELSKRELDKAYETNRERDTLYQAILQLTTALKGCHGALMEMSQDSNDWYKNTSCYQVAKEAIEASKAITNKG